MAKMIDQEGDRGTCFECGKPIRFTGRMWVHIETNAKRGHVAVPTQVASILSIIDPFFEDLKPGDIIGVRIDTGKGKENRRAMWDGSRLVLLEDAPQEQLTPATNDLPAVWDLVQADMKARDAVGAKRYGTRLQPHNGRDVMRDAYEEALDLCVYLRQAIYERDGK
jgi:hypothetical protein